MDQLIYTGEFLSTSQLGLDAYEPSTELRDAVNLAMLLEQPLLLMGEPGCGKTRLAEAVAAELHKEKWKDHYFRWDIKSTSKAKEGIYQYDALKRMYDANTKNADARIASKYITSGKFQDALTKPQNGHLPNILLIDEIDKADIDFPNDLLSELEKGEFFIPELNDTVYKKSKVLIFITSNRERELPAAFLRRCLYHYITFPKKEDLIKIINAKFNNENNNDLVRNAVNLFLDIRAKIEGQFAENEKKPSTSELLQWFSVIEHYQQLQRSDLVTAEIAAVFEAISNYEPGSVNNFKIPFPQVLLKTWESRQLFEIQ